MYMYAQLNNENVVVGISQLSGEVLRDNMIDITDLETVPELGSRYDSMSGTFEAPKPMPEPVPQPTQEEIQTQTLLNTEYLVAMTELSNI